MIIRGAPLNRAHPLARDLRIFLPLNEGAGDKVGDIVQPGRNLIGTLTNGPGWGAGDPRIGGGVALGGSNEHVLIDNLDFWRNGFTNIKPHSWLLWFRMNAPAPAGQYLFFADVQHCHCQYIGLTDKWRYRTNNESYDSPGTWSGDNDWHQLVITHDGSTIRWYFDAVSFGSMSAGWSDATGADFKLGHHNISSLSGVFGQFAGWQRVLTYEDVFGLYRDPNVFVGTRIRTSYFPLPEVGGADVTLSGAVAATSTVAGALTVEGTVELAGAVAGASTAAGALSADLVLAGAADGQSSIAGALSPDRGLIGSVAAVSTVDGDLVLEASLVGSLAAAATAAGALSLEASLAGAATALATVEGVLSLDQVLAGAIAAQSTVDGSLSISGIIDLEGTAAGVSTVDGAISVDKVLAGSAGGVSTAAGALTVTAVVELAGAANAVATVVGTLSLDVALAGAAAAAGAVTGDLTVEVGDIELAGTVVGASVVAGDLVLDVELVGTIAGQSVVLGTLTVVGISTLGTVVDTSIESLTPARTIVSITSRRTIHSIRDGVVIE